MFKKIALAVAFAYFALSALSTGAQETESPEPQMAEEETDAPDPIKRAVFTFGIEEREPIDDVDSVSTDSTHVFFFTEIVGQTGTTITHRWIYDGETMAEVPFQIGGPRWRVYSSKKFIPEWTGSWKVAVVDPDGIVMSEKTLVYYKPE
jgi:hypothetical protein